MKYIIMPIKIPAPNRTPREIKQILRIFFDIARRFIFISSFFQYRNSEGVKEFTAFRVFSGLDVLSASDSKMLLTA